MKRPSSKRIAVAKVRPAMSVKVKVTSSASRAMPSHAVVAAGRAASKVKK
jgi:hypothetical protein